MKNITCKYCQKKSVVDSDRDHDFCLLSRFYHCKSLELSDRGDVHEMWGSPENLAKLNFRFEVVPEGKWTIWGNDYRVKAYVSDSSGKEKTDYVYLNSKFDFFRRSSATEALNKFVNQLNQERDKGIKKSQTKISEETSRQALTQAQPTADQISELIKKELSQIDLAKYIQQIDTLTQKNQDSINTLQISPAENAAAIARLKAIQVELAKRKKIAQELEQKKIGQQLAEQKHQLEIVQQQIEAKGQEFETAKQAGKTEEAKKINDEYNELRRKQAAVTAFIVNLEENAAYHTFVRFNSLEELYNPDTNVVVNQVTVTETPLTWGEKAAPYLQWGLGGIIITGILYLIYRYFYKKIS